MKAVITVIGHDKVGIIAGVSEILAEKKVNILDIRQTISQDYFTMVMIVDFAKTNITLQELKDNFDEKEDKLGVSIRIQHEDIFNAMHKI